MSLLVKIFDSALARILTFVLGIVGLYIGIASYVDGVPGRGVAYSLRQKPILSNFKDMGSVKVKVGDAELSASPSNMVIFSVSNSGNSEIESIHVVDKVRFTFTTDLLFVGHSLINEFDMSNIKLSRENNSFSIDIVQKWFPSSGFNLIFVSKDSVSDPIVSKSGQVRDFKKLSQPYQTVSSRILNYIEINKGFSLYFFGFSVLAMLLAVLAKSFSNKIKNQRVQVMSEKYAGFVFSDTGNLVYQVCFMIVMIVIFLPAFF